MFYFSVLKFSYIIYCLLKRKYRNEKICFRKKGFYFIESVFRVESFRVEKMI